MKWNPFSHLTKTQSHPFGELVHASLGKRISDGFFAIWGGFYLSRSGRTPSGLLDYSLFQLPVFLSTQTVYNYKMLENFFEGVIETVMQIDSFEGFSMALAMVFDLALTLAKLAVFSVLTGLAHALKFTAAVALTVALVTPISLLAHILTLPSRWMASNAINQLKVTTYAEQNINNNIEISPPEQDLITCLNQKIVELAQLDDTVKAVRGRILPGRLDEDLEIKLQQHNSTGTSKIKLMLIQNGADRALVVSDNNHEASSYWNGPGQGDKLIELKPENAAGIKALLYSNFFNATADIEREVSPTAIAEVEQVINALNVR